MSPKSDLEELRSNWITPTQTPKPIKAFFFSIPFHMRFISELFVFQDPFLQLNIIYKHHHQATAQMLFLLVRTPCCVRQAHSKIEIKQRNRILRAKFIPFNNERLMNERKSNRKWNFNCSRAARRKAPFRVIH